ncbi:MAG TPA: hypothetical protein VJ689_08260 [Gaiellaceae bacterium]|nr:hypothetical protein [Gaiellaceae bacterium]
MGALLEAVRTTLGRRDAAPASPPAEHRPVIVTHAEAAACTCPERCERDHEQD